MTRDIPYDAWADYIDGILRGKASLVLDLACGTGNVTLRLADRGYDMIGVDASGDMLAQAQDKALTRGRRVLWLEQDMGCLDLYGTVDAVVCTCDGLNYIRQPDGLREVFRRVRLFLNPGGIFIFDMNTEYKFKEVLKNGTYGDSAGDVAYEWDNRYDPATKINAYKLRIYISPAGTAPVMYEENHYQRAYDLGAVSNWLLEAGFSAVQLRDGYGDAPPKADSTRVTFICR